MEKPDNIHRAERFEHGRDAPVSYKRRDWAAPILLSMMANTGVIRCYGLDPNFDGIGAVAANARDYRGMAYVAQGKGEARVVEWSPNRALVEVSGASPGALVVYNMNYDPSWRANGEPALEHSKSVATKVAAGVQRVEFTYFPRSFKGSIPITLATLLIIISSLWWRRGGAVVRQSTGSGRPGEPSRGARGPGAGSDPSIALDQTPSD